MLSEKEINILIEEALRTRENAYCPYSKFKVGAALLAESGMLYTGCNFENASFGAGTCAERVALGTAIAKGERKFTAIAVAGGDHPLSPCGICRQALSEFGDIIVICTDSKGENFEVYKLSELLKNAFTEFEV